MWAADTNYRVTLPNEAVRRLAEEDNYSALLEADQVRSRFIRYCLQSLTYHSVQLVAGMKERGVFAGYEEAPILFRPTYVRRCHSRVSFFLLMIY